MGLLEELESLNLLKPGVAAEATAAYTEEEARMAAEAGIDLPSASNIATEPQSNVCLDTARRLVTRAQAAGSVA